MKVKSVSVVFDNRAEGFQIYNSRRKESSASFTSISRSSESNHNISIGKEHRLFPTSYMSLGSGAVSVHLSRLRHGNHSQTEDDGIDVLYGLQNIQLCVIVLGNNKRNGTFQNSQLTHSMYV